MSAPHRSRKRLCQVEARGQAGERGSRHNLSRTWYRQIDATYVAILLLSFTVHATVMAYALSVPAPEPATLEALGQQENRWIHLIVRGEPPDDPGKKGEDAPKASADRRERRQVAEKPEAAGADLPARLESPPGEKEHRRRRKEELMKKGILRVLGSRFQGSRSRHGLTGSDFLAARDAPGLETLLNPGVKGLLIASRVDVSLRGPGASSGLIGASDVDRLASRTEVITEKRVADRVPSGRFDIEKPPEMIGAMDRITLDEVIKKHLPGVTACYDRALKLFPSLRGKLYIDFTVEENGRISRVDVQGPGASEPDMVECIKRRVSWWRFPPSDHGRVDISLPVVLTASSRVTGR